MICPKCREQMHEMCPGETWCDCQHRVPEMEAPPLPPELMEVVDRLAADPSSGVRRERPRRHEEDFYVEDEPVEDVIKAWESANKGVTGP